MQETAFIWDLDGTLLDSYEAILAGIEETYRQFSLPYNKKEVRVFILKYSVMPSHGDDGNHRHEKAFA